jgi:hypothetical protein
VSFLKNNVKVRMQSIVENHRWTFAVILGVIFGMLFVVFGMLPVHIRHECSWINPVETEYGMAVLLTLLSWRAWKRKDAFVLFVVITEVVIHLSQIYLG